MFQDSPLYFTTLYCTLLPLTALLCTILHQPALQCNKLLSPQHNNFLHFTLVQCINFTAPTLNTKQNIYHHKNLIMRWHLNLRWNFTAGGSKLFKCTNVQHFLMAVGVDGLCCDFVWRRRFIYGWFI